MPEKFIDRMQKDVVQEWVHLQNGIVRRRFGPRNVEVTYNVQGEALSITFKEQPDVDVMGGYGVDHPDELILVCSDNHAKAMEAAGVLSFSE